MIKTFLRIGQGFFQAKYQKYKVTRLPGQEFVVFLPDQASVAELFYHIKFNFGLEDSHLLAGAAFTSDLAAFPVNDEMLQANTQISDTPFLPLLMANGLYVYEVKNQKAHLMYGLEIMELNVTNNRNLPEKIQTGITQLSYDWEHVKTVEDAMVIHPLSDPHDPKAEEEKQQLETNVGTTANMISALNNLKMEDPLKEFVKKMTLLMGSNWIFLYAVTFGFYGWDVGEPISYLTTVGVDLLALLRVFDLEERIENEIAITEGRWMGLLNLYALKNKQRWVHRYLRRQIN